MVYTCRDCGIELKVGTTDADKCAVSAPGVASRARAGAGAPLRARADTAAASSRPCMRRMARGALAAPPMDRVRPRRGGLALLWVPLRFPLAAACCACPALLALWHAATPVLC